MKPQSKSAPLVSLVVPVFNVWDHVEGCLASIALQTFADFEVIIVNDGSTDGSAEIAQRWAERDARFSVVHQENKGLSVARNEGLDRALGSLIGFVDSDDQIAPDFLARMVEVLERTECDWVACAIQFRGEAGLGAAHSAIHGAADLWLHPPLSRKPLPSWCDVISHFPSAWNKLYRRDLIGDTRFDEGTLFEDHSFFLRLAAKTDHMVHIAEPLYLQTRGRAGQITAADDDGVFQQFSVLERMQAIMEATDTKADAKTAYERIATRLLFERSVALASPVRRKQFAMASREWMAVQGLAFSPEWDADIARSWLLEMNGDLPLSVLVHVPIGMEKDASSLVARLGEENSLRLQAVVVLQNTSQLDALRLPELPFVVVAKKTAKDTAAAFEVARASACGVYLFWLPVGNKLLPGALREMMQRLLIDESDICIVAHTEADSRRHSGFLDGSKTQQRYATSGLVDFDTTARKAFDGRLDTMMMRRNLAHQLHMPSGCGRHAARLIAMQAAQLAKSVSYLSYACLERGGGLGEAVSALKTIQTHRRATQMLSVAQEDPRRFLARLITSDRSHMGSNSALYAAQVLAYAASLRSPKGQPSTLDPETGPRTALLANPWGALGGSDLLSAGSEASK